MGEIDQLNFNNEEGGVEYVKNYREYLVCTGTNFTFDREAKKDILNKFINSFIENEIKVNDLFSPEVG